MTGNVVAIGFNPFNPIKGAIQSTASSFLDSIGKAFCNMAADLSSSVFGFASQKTSIDLNKAYFMQNYDIVFGIAALVVMAIFICAAIMAAVRGDPHMMVRALASTGTAIIGSFIALALLDMVLAASDGMATALGADKPLGGDLVAQLRALPKNGNFALDMVLSLLVALFAFTLFLVLYVRKIAILAVALFIPLMLAGQPAMSTRGWMKRAVEALAALIFMKPVIYAIFTLGAGLAADGSGSATDQTLAILSGIVIMVASVFSPLALLYLFGVAEVQMSSAISGAGRRSLSSFGHGAGALLGSSSRETFRGVGARLQSRTSGAGAASGLGGGVPAAIGAGASKAFPALPAGSRPSMGGAAVARVRRSGAGVARQSQPVQSPAAGSANGARAAASRAGTPAPYTRSSGGRQSVPQAPAPRTRAGRPSASASPPSSTQAPATRVQRSAPALPPAGRDR